MSGSSGSSRSTTLPPARRTNGESGPENRPTWRLKDARTTSSWSVMDALLQSRAVRGTASAAKDAAIPVAMRAGSPVRAGAWPEDGDDLVAIWHTHELHQLLYAFEGVAEVETAGSHHLLPPQQAAWIPAGLPHQTTLRKVRTVAVFFEPSMVEDRSDRVRVLSARAPVREMIVYAARSAHRPTGQRSHRRRLLRRAGTAHRRVARDGGDAAAPADELVAGRGRGHGVHAGAPRRRRRARGVRRGRALGAVVAPPVPGRDRYELAGLPHHQPGDAGHGTARRA